AIRALELRNLAWPQLAADGHMRLGKIYALPTLHDRVRAAREFQTGLSLVPAQEQENYRKQMPGEFRESM
ncbi:MAG: hypothetical protein PHH58_07760, partial [Rhodoferax sp.]|nr:hypothetical protein [Rhodoferax sp.]